MADCDLMAVHLLLAKAFVASEPYDVRGGRLLLKSMTANLGDGSPTPIDIAAYLRVMAGLGGDPGAVNHAQWSMHCVVDCLEKQFEMNW